MELYDIGRMGGLPWLSTSLPAGLEASETAFPLTEYLRRRQETVQSFQETADLFCVFRPSSVEYLCGFHTLNPSPQPLVVMADGRTALCVPDDEVGRALASAVVDEVWFYGTKSEDGMELLAAALLKNGGKGTVVGMETHQEATPARFVLAVGNTGLGLWEGGDLVERQRLRLSMAEQQYVEKAALLTQAGVEAAVAECGSDGATDSSVAAAIMQATVQSSDSSAVIGPVVVAGRRAGITHSTFAQHPLRAGEAVFLEFAGTWRRYHAPVMRTLLLDGPTSPELRVLSDLAEQCVAELLVRMRPGVQASTIATEVRTALGSLPPWLIFHHTYGYPVGLAHPPSWLDSAPFYIREDNHDLLEPGMLFHLPGSFRAFGRAGVGLSQTVLVTADGCRSMTTGEAVVQRLRSRTVD
jgi:Xaa-Pro dipeptidase